MAANQRLSPIFYGFMPQALGNGNTVALNATTTWAAWSFVAEQAFTLSKVRLFCLTKTGTLASTDCTCDLYSDASGIPNASIESRNTITSAVASSTWVEWTGFTTTLTAGLRYWLVFKNVNAVAASNNPTYYYPGNAHGSPLGGPVLGTPTWGWDAVQTLTSGAAWATSVREEVVGPRIEYSNGTFAGMPISDTLRGSNAASGAIAFGKQEVGVTFTLAANARLNVAGIMLAVAQIGTPGNLRFRLYSGTTLLGTTSAILTANVSTSNLYKFAYFSSPIAIDSTMTLHAVAGDATAGDTSSNGYGVTVYTTENDANSKALKPFDGTMSFTVCADNTAVSFTDTDTKFVPMALLLDTNGPFQAGGTGGMLFIPNMEGT